MKGLCYIVWAVSTLVLVACKQEGGEPDAGTPMMRLFSVADGLSATEGSDVDSDVAQKAVLLFWELEHYEDDQVDYPYLVARPEKGINAYRDDPYNTHSFYPPKDNIVVAVGYSPQELVSSQSNGRDDFLELSLPKGMVGPATDLLSSAAPVYGSASNPFDKADRRESLAFLHAQSRVTFRAQLAEEMDLAVRRVRIELDPSVVTGSLVWNAAADRFVAKAGGGAFLFGQGTGDAPLTKGVAAVVGTVYVLADQKELPVRITVEKSDDGFGKQIQTTTFPAVLRFRISRDPSKLEDHGKEADRLYAGEAYTFTIFFDRSTLQLIGKQVPWEDGGKISIPLVPNEKP